MNKNFEKELDEMKSDQQYGTVVKSPTGMVHVLGKIENTTFCGREFIEDKGWELYEDFFFYEITCKKCRALEIKRMESEIEDLLVEEIMDSILPLSLKNYK